MAGHVVVGLEDVPPTALTRPTATVANRGWLSDSRTDLSSA